SFIISAALLSRIPAARREVEGAAEVRVRDGWYALVDDPFIRRFFVGYTVVGACAVVGESLVALYALRVLQDQAGVSGLLAAAIPGGAILATVLARAHGDETSKLRRASVVALIGAAIGIAVFASAPALPVVLIGFAAIGALNASRVPANEVAVLRLEDRMRAPTFAVLNGFLLGSQAIAAGLGGVLARGLGVRKTIMASLVLAGIVGLWARYAPHTRRATGSARLRDSRQIEAHRRRLQQAHDVVCLHGVAVQEALCLIAAVVAEEDLLLERLDTLGHALDVEAARHRDHGRDDRRLGVVTLDLVDERAVDLQAVDRVAAQTTQHRVAGAEVVDGELDAEIADLVERTSRDLFFADGDAFRDLELEEVRWQRGDAQRPLDDVDQPLGCMEVATGDVHGHADLRQAGVDPRPRLLARLVEHPVVDGDDET